MVEGKRLKMVPENFLNIKEVLFDEVIGSPFLALIIGFIVIMVFITKKGLPHEVGLMLSVVFAIIMINAYGFVALWSFLVLMIGGFFYLILTKKVNR